MTEFKIEAMPSRKVESDKVVYYVKDQNTLQLITKFDTDTLKADDITGWEKFTSAQKLELKNYLANVRFVIDKLHLPAKLNRAYRIALPLVLQKALIDLSELAATHEVPFDPMAAMLNGLLNYLITTEKRINRFQKTEILNAINIDLIQNEKAIVEKEARKYTKKIFKVLMRQPHYLEKYATTALTMYDKETNINSSTIHNYSEGKAKPSQWSISCALTILGHEKINLFDKMPLATLILLWLKPLQFLDKITNKSEAYKRFCQTFPLDLSQGKQAKEIINSYF